MIKRYIVTVDSETSCDKLRPLIINCLKHLLHFNNAKRISIADYDSEGYIALSFPDYQKYMDKDWFLKESYYDAKQDTYLIPKDRL